MTWLIVIGGVVGAWAMLSVLCGERHRRVQVIDLETAARRQAAARAAEHLAAQTRKHPSKPASA